MDTFRFVYEHVCCCFLKCFFILKYIKKIIFKINDQNDPKHIKKLIFNKIFFNFFLKT